MTLPEDYLDRTGYRMPTAAEWEYMCRAGATTVRFFGRSESLLGEYAWYNHNSNQRTWPVGLLKPNDFGLFDIHGNVREWCINRHVHRYLPGKGGMALDVEETDRLIAPTLAMQTRGGSYNDHPRFIRAAGRDTAHEAETGNNLNGLRLVRTIKSKD